MIANLIHIDRLLFYFVNHEMANPFFDWVMPFITNQWNWAIPILLIWAGMLIIGNKKARIAALLIFLTVSATDPICARVLKPTFKRIRPSRSLEDTRLLVKKGGKYGFPSNHAANVTGAMMILLYFFRRYKYAFASIALLISYSRVYVGVHYPFDVCFGILIGVLFAVFWIYVWIFVSNHLSKREKFYLTISKE
ncbi:MAG: phosphatase PAP2 family protein [Candidatus Marinimicrobia bacterium]|nr:phosphatase PAP2 family protein [Candidatus Neomarinimicrobiota bacterium]